MSPYETQVAELAEMVRPFLRGEPDSESVTAAVEAAWASWQDFLSRAVAPPYYPEGGPSAQCVRHATFAGLFARLSGTYDEFRAEAGAA